MKVRDQLLLLFEENKGKFLSGEEIANKFSVSRNAVWKAVKSLQNDGYEIVAVTNKGYCMSELTDFLSESIISKQLNGIIPYKVNVYKTIDSTNTYLKDLANKSAPHGTVVISEEQTAGRGRLNRTFYSPSNTGIYMSILIRPNAAFEYVNLITALTAVCVCEAIESVCDKKAEIKWVNDIYIDNKKVSGILTEASFNMENLLVDYIVVGIGINVFSPIGQFPSEIENIANSIFGGNRVEVRNRLCAEVLNKFAVYFSDIDKRDFVKEYQDRSCVVGKEIVVSNGSDSYFAKAVSIDENCRLIIENDLGEQGVLSVGEVSVKIG